MRRSSFYLKFLPTLLLILDLSISIKQNSNVHRENSHHMKVKDQGYIPPIIRKIRKDFQSRFSQDYSSLLLEQEPHTLSGTKPKDSFGHGEGSERNLSTDGPYPLRILFETSHLDALRTDPSLTSSSKSINDRINFLKQTILPSVSQIWSSHLSLRTPSNRYRISPDICFGMLNLFENNNFVPDASLIIFVTADECSEDDTVLAYALPCAMDSETERPIVGIIHFCINTIELDENGSMKASQERESIEIATHELGHVLGMNSDLFPLFRDENGNPRTSRPFRPQMTRCADGSTRSNIVSPSENTLVYTEFGYEVVTPRVTAVVRNQFDCQTISGARLENQPTSPQDCFGSHWDERLFYTESMGAIYSHEANVLSPLTIALLEDSGWYVGNYTDVNISTFGHGAGCDFIYEDCIQNSEIPPYSKGFFCNTPGSVSQLGVFTTQDFMCSPDLTHVAFCDLIDHSRLSPQYQGPPPFKYQYFTNKNVGPILFLRANYCPIPQGLLDQDCRYKEDDEDSSPTHPFSNVIQDFGAKRGENSKCFNFNRLSSSGWRPDGICLETKCNSNKKILEVYIDGNVVECKKDFETHDFPGYFGAKLECPRMSVACPNFICPANCAGRGRCDFKLQRCICDEAGVGPDCFGDPVPTNSPTQSFIPTHSSSPSTFYSSSISIRPNYVYFYFNIICFTAMIIGQIL